jgi:hypothetical protein
VTVGNLKAPEDSNVFECDEGNGPCNKCADCVDVEPESLWRERNELLADFDQAIESVEGDDGSDFSEVGRAEIAVKRVEFEVAIGTRDALADVVDELRELNKLVRRVIDEALIRKTFKS